MHAGLRIALILVLGFAGSACERASDKPSQVDRARQELERLYDEAMKRAPEDPVEWAREDLQRVGDWEYRVTFIAATENQLLEQELNRLGEERWEAFWVRDSESGLTLFLKRPARSYLKLVPLSEIGKMISPGETQ